MPSRGVGFGGGAEVGIVPVSAMTPRNSNIPGFPLHAASTARVGKLGLIATDECLVIIMTLNPRQRYKEFLDCANILNRIPMIFSNPTCRTQVITMIEINLVLYVVR